MFITVQTITFSCNTTTWTTNFKWTSWVKLQKWYVHGILNVIEHIERKCKKCLRTKHLSLIINYSIKITNWILRFIEKAIISSPWTNMVFILFILLIRLEWPGQETNQRMHVIWICSNIMFFFNKTWVDIVICICLSLIFD